MEEGLTVGEVLTLSLISSGHLESIEANLLSNQDANCFHNAVNATVAGAKENTVLFAISNKDDLEGSWVMSGRGTDSFGIYINVKEVILFGQLSSTGI
jgi:hypothetical protein